MNYIDYVAVVKFAMCIFIVLRKKSIIYFLIYIYVASISPDLDKLHVYVYIFVLLYI